MLFPMNRNSHLSALSDPEFPEFHPFPTQHVFTPNRSDSSLFFSGKEREEGEKKNLMTNLRVFILAQYYHELGFGD